MRLLHLAVLAGLSACTGTGSGHVNYSATVTTPELVYIEDDVQVVADYDQPVFYTESYYWRYDNGVWYRSNNHARGWVRVEAVPTRLRRIDRPTAYVHYRGDGRGHARARGPEVRDHRDDQKAERRELREEQKAERRELREDQKQIRNDVKDTPKDVRKDIKEDQKDARKEQQQQQKEERKEQKQDQKQERKDHKKGR